MYKLSIEADSMKEILQELAETFEEMGCIILKSNEELPENLENFLKFHNTKIFRKEDGFNPDLLDEMIEAEQEEVLSHILENKECLDRILQILSEKGFSIKENE